MSTSRRREEGATMPYFSTSDGTEIYYTDDGAGRPVLLSHAWPLNSDEWGIERDLLVAAGHRVIAHDRRGHGRSGRPWHGNDLDTCARDLAELVEHLGLSDLVLVGHSLGAGEVVRYAARHGRGRVRKIIAVSAPPPVVVRTDAFDAIRTGMLRGRARYLKELAWSFLGANRRGSGVTQDALDEFWRAGMDTGMLAAYEGIESFAEADLTEDLRSLDVPVYLLHGDDDQIVPIEESAYPSIDLVADGMLKVYRRGPHGIAGSFRSRLDLDLVRLVA